MQCNAQAALTKLPELAVVAQRVSCMAPRDLYPTRELWRASSCCCARAVPPSPSHASSLKNMAFPDQPICLGRRKLEKWPHLALDNSSLPSPAPRFTFQLPSPLPPPSLFLPPLPSILYNSKIKRLFTTVPQAQQLHKQFSADLRLRIKQRAPLLRMKDQSRDKGAHTRYLPDGPFSTFLSLLFISFLKTM
jgi:hypothetical protein